MKTILILMAAVVPTIGHDAMIKFAAKFPLVSNIHVVIPGRSGEPVSAKDRCRMLDLEKNPRISFYAFEDDYAPQNDPGGEASNAFWGYWKLAVASTTGKKNYDYVVASEPYGMKLAEVMGAEFIPFDLDRQIYPVSGTQVRENIFQNWDLINPEFRKMNQRRYVVFGQEHVGKSSLGKMIAQKNAMAGVAYIPEYARPYLETVGAELTDDKMINIGIGQVAYERLVVSDVAIPIAIFDTDILSTIGYYKLKNWSVPGWLEDILEKTPEKLYFLLPDDVQFEPDILHYGVDKRESDYEFWKNLLEEYGRSYCEVPVGALEDKANFIAKAINSDLDLVSAPYKNFVRD